MGEVNRPGTFTIKNDRISILDAFGYVGDLAITANRKNILLIRDNDGQKEFVRMDITDPSLFTSPYFYLNGKMTLFMLSPIWQSSVILDLVKANSII